jgi:hypothetical protein
MAAAVVGYLGFGMLIVGVLMGMGQNTTPAFRFVAALLVWVGFVFLVIGGIVSLVTWRYS